MSGSDIGSTNEHDEIVKRLESDTTTIGYFPTFREDKPEIEPFEQELLEEFLAEHNVQLTVKPHRHMNIQNDLKANNIIRLPPNLDSYRILSQIDILITDYSSIYFDFLLLDRPTIFYTFDHNAYMESRGVMPNYEQLLAGPRVNNFEDLLRELRRTLSCEEPTDGRTILRDQIHNWQDGRSCDRIHSNFS
jgi:CDP-glycerol glycerophosphotransferase